MNILKLQLIVANSPYYQIIQKERSQSAIVPVYEFLNGDGYTEIERLQQSDFYSLDLEDGISIDCLQGNDVCYIYNSNSQHFQTYEHKKWELFKFMSPNYSCKISKQNFIQTAKKWKNLYLTATPYLLLWQDIKELLHIEAFQTEQALQERYAYLISNNLVITFEDYKKIFLNQPEQQEEANSCLLKVFNKTWGYTSLKRITTEGLCNLLNFLQNFSNLEIIQDYENNILNIKTINKDSIVYYEGIGPVVLQSQSFICFILSLSTLDTLTDIKHRPIATISKHLDNNNSLKLTQDNLHSIFESWRQILINKPACVLIWQDKQEWIRIEFFDNEQAMNEYIATVELAQSDVHFK